MIPFSPQQTCAKCNDPAILRPRFHRGWFKRDEWLEYECKCGYIFRTETAEAKKARSLSGDNLDELLTVLPPCVDNHGNTIDVVSELSKHA